METTQVDDPSLATQRVVMNIKVTRYTRALLKTVAAANNITMESTIEKLIHQAAESMGITIPSPDDKSYQDAGDFRND